MEIAWNSESTLEVAIADFSTSILIVILGFWSKFKSIAYVLKVAGGLATRVGAIGRILEIEIESIVSLSLIYKQSAKFVEVNSRKQFSI